MTRLFAPVLILVLAGCQDVSRASSGSEVAEGPELHTYREVDGAELRAYVFSPQTDPDPSGKSAVLLFRGGGWSIGIRGDPVSSQTPGR